MNVRNILSVLFFGIAVSACDNTVTETVSDVTPVTVFEKFMERGFTCDVQQQLLAFDDADLRTFTQMVQQADLTVEERRSLADEREQGCDPISDSVDAGISAQVQAITGTYSVVFVPEAATGGVYGSSSFRDSSSSSWMCNSGSPESPADYVMQFHLQGAYFSRNSLKLQGQNLWGSCYLGSTNASRVYSDDDVRTCIGYWTVIACGGTPPLTTDMKLGL